MTKREEARAALVRLVEGMLDGRVRRDNVARELGPGLDALEAAVRAEKPKAPRKPARTVA